ncbi:ferredoxin--NADP reductase [Pseudoalteromonas fuliginea]|uniref:ferredoxin--NADP(+) reductase n=1 Tax=Pseudoalteromonas fuliginea TaxID=1872678 RepID=A0ABD3YDA4_9GAMM|nr:MULTISPECIES: ferredoxin--NADP reductase [Pseudoalteromonas]ALQ10493.1 ferredoxin--NADP reductase [Pseudoalteromonas sp. Bsw20308]KDC52677.1 ferredoxin-NADP reductase [Pseudoalteromonas fuliginea]KJZ26411.1 ferredoxin-NADP reductase [Pseudoalteromonas fuliginea]
MSNWVDATVKKVTWWNETLFSLTVNADVEPFKAGQFTKLSIIEDDKRIARAYSYVNSPDSSALEFYLINVADGLLSPRLAKLQPGDNVLIERRATGFFTLDEIPQSEQLWMLGTGTAIGPFLSILQQSEVWQKYQHINLVHGVRFNSDLSYQPLINELLKAYPAQLNYIPVVSREEPLEGLHGRITDAIQSSRLFDKVKLDPAPNNAQFMICGNPQMVKDTTELLIGKSFKRNRRREPGHITVEQYW